MTLRASWIGTAAAAIGGAAGPMSATLAGAALLVAPAVVQAAPAKVKVGKPVLFEPGIAAQSATLVQQTSKADLSQVRRVVIPYFQVEVQSKGGKTASSQAFMSSMRNNVSVTYHIEGIDQAAMQALTDALYADLVASFQARGIEVVDRAEARARSRNYAKLEAGWKPAPADMGLAGGGRSTFYAPTGMGLYMVGIENVGNGGPLAGLGGIGGALSGFSQLGTGMAEASSLNELDAALVGVRLKVVFVEASALKANGFVQVSHRAAIAVQPVDTQLWIMAPASQAPKGANQRVQFQLTSGIVPASSPILSVDDTMSTGKKIDTALGNLIGGLSGTSSYEVKEYTIRLDPARFTQAMVETLGGTQRLLIDRVKATAAP